LSEEAFSSLEVAAEILVAAEIVAVAVAALDVSDEAPEDETESNQETKSKVK